MPSTNAKAGADNAAPAGAAPEGAAKVRVIKKYPNRRLYDTDSSSYITLGDVKALVMRGEPFVVRDARSGADLTRSILLQIILEEETAGVPLFSEKMLANIIRFYGHAMQGFMGSYLERNLQLFLELQQKMAEQAKEVTPELWQQFMAAQSPLMIGNLFAQSQKAFLQMQEQMLGALTGKRPH